MQEVIDLTQLTQVPGGPKYLRGVINLRGHVVPVYDLRIPFDLAIDPKPPRAPCVLIVETHVANDTGVTGLLVGLVSRTSSTSRPRRSSPRPRWGWARRFRSCAV